MGNTQIINWDPVRISTKNCYLTHPSKWGIDYTALPVPLKILKKAKLTRLARLVRLAQEEQKRLRM